MKTIEDCAILGSIVLADLLRQEGKWKYSIDSGGFGFVDVTGVGRKALLVLDRSFGCCRFPTRSWPKAIHTVAWGNAPGPECPRACLAEGHIQFAVRSGVNMAFGQKDRCVFRVPGALPQATLNNGLRPNEHEYEVGSTFFSQPKLAFARSATKEG